MVLNHGKPCNFAAAPAIGMPAWHDFFACRPRSVYSPLYPHSLHYSSHKRRSSSVNRDHVSITIARYSSEKRGKRAEMRFKIRQEQIKSKLHPEEEV